MLTPPPSLSTHPTFLGVEGWGGDIAIDGAIGDILDNGADPNRMERLRREFEILDRAYHFSGHADSIWISSVEECCLGCQGLLLNSVWSYRCVLCLCFPFPLPDHVLNSLN